MRFKVVFNSKCSSGFNGLTVYLTGEELGYPLTGLLHNRLSYEGYEKDVGEYHYWVEGGLGYLFATLKGAALNETHDVFVVNGVVFTKEEDKVLGQTNRCFKDIIDDSIEKIVSENKKDAHLFHIDKANIDNIYNICMNNFLNFNPYSEIDYSDKSDENIERGSSVESFYFNKIDESIKNIINYPYNFLTKGLPIEMAVRNYIYKKCADLFDMAFKIYSENRKNFFETFFNNKIDERINKRQEKVEKTYLPYLKTMQKLYPVPRGEVSTKNEHEISEINSEGCLSALNWYNKNLIHKPFNFILHKRFYKQIKDNYNAVKNEFPRLIKPSMD